MSAIKIEQLPIKDAFIVKGKRFLDDRGFFEELYNQSKYSKPITKSWDQVSLASSKADVLRGLHCSNYAKYVTCVKGEVYDVIVDLRPDSPTYLKWTGVWLNADEPDPVSVYVPKRCGHGYYCKRDSLFLYLQDGVFTPSEDIELNLFDQKINVEWPKPINEYIISEKDRKNLSYEDIKNRIMSTIQLSTNVDLDRQYFEIYSPQNIMITGGAGFIASHVTILLTQKYPHYNIFVYDILDYCANLKNLKAIENAPNFKFIKGDICNFDMVKFVMEQFKIDSVLHFAAQSHVDISLKNSLKFTEVNVVGTHVLLESARQCNIKRFIHVSTDEVYGTTDTVSDVNQALEPTNPYACSKLAAECTIKAYQKCFKMPIIISRGNNVYGPHQFLEKVIPKFISRLLKGKKCCIHDDGSSERDFLYVTDVAEAFDLLLHNGKVNEFYNIGSTKGVTVLELARKLVSFIKKVPPGKEDEFIEYVPGRILDDKRYKIDSSRIKQLGWSPKIDIDEGLKKTIEWYQSNPNHWDNSDYALEPHPLAIKMS